MDATRVALDAVLFVEPETPEGRALSERNRGSGIVALPWDSLARAAAVLFSTWQAHGHVEATIAAARDVVHALAGGAGAAVVWDERIVRAIEYVNSHLGATLTLEEVAQAACLSPSRFRHHFVEQTGTALRPYVLWRRFLRAWQVAMRGGSLSTAAHTAGFADAAHLTRTSHRMFGFAPSALRTTRGTTPDCTRRTAAREMPSPRPLAIRCCSGYDGARGLGARVTADLETVMAVDSEAPPPVFTYGRLTLWLVLALMVVSVGYSAWHVVANWSFIKV